MIEPRPGDAGASCRRSTFFDNDEAAVAIRVELFGADGSVTTTTVVSITAA